MRGDSVFTLVFTTVASLILFWPKTFQPPSETYLFFGLHILSWVFPALVVQKNRWKCAHTRPRRGTPFLVPTLFACYLGVRSCSCPVVWLSQASAHPLDHQQLGAQKYLELFIELFFQFFQSCSHRVIGDVEGSIAIVVPSHSEPSVPLHCARCHRPPPPHQYWFCLVVSPRLFSHVCNTEPTSSIFTRCGSQHVSASAACQRTRTSIQSPPCLRAMATAIAETNSHLS